MHVRNEASLTLMAYNLSRISYELFTKCVTSNVTRVHLDLTVNAMAQTLRHLCRLDRRRATEMTRLGTPCCGALREQNSCLCQACFISMREATDSMPVFI